MFEGIKMLMPARVEVPHAQASNEQYKPAKRPVALFFGGTSGIGQAMAEQLAKQTSGKVQIVLLGRNQDAASKIIASFPRTPDGTPPDQESKYSFVKVDATSMAQVREVTSKLSKELDKINFIILSAGFLSIKGRDETSEGIDRKLACHFYARFRFVFDLVPLVATAEEKGEKTGVMSVLAAGRGGAVDLNDLGLVKTFSVARARGNAATYTDATFEELATRYPKVPFMHIGPGSVITPMTSSLPVLRFLFPLARPLRVTAEQCAQIMWWRMLSPESQWETGAHQLNNHGEEIEHNKFVTPEMRKAVWDHAVQITSGKSEGTTTS